MKATILYRNYYKSILMVLPFVILITNCSSENIDLSYVQNQDKIITSRKYDIKEIEKLILQYTQAINDNKKISNIDKAKTYLRIASLNYLIDKKDDAINDVTTSIKYNDRDYNAYFLRGYIYEEKRKFNLAYNDYQKVIQLNPRTFGIYKRRGFIYFSLNKLNAAVEDFTHEIRQHPNSYYPYVLRGDSYKKLKKYKSAIKDYTKAITILSKKGVCTSIDKTCFSPIEVDIYLKIGEIYEKQELYKKAILTYSDAIKTNPGSAKPYNNLGWVFLTASDLRIRDPKKALKYAIKANQLSRGNDVEILDTLATAYYVNKKYEDAYKTIKQANTISPTDKRIKIKLEKYENTYRSRRHK